MSLVWAGPGCALKGANLGSDCSLMGWMLNSFSDCRVWVVSGCSRAMQGLVRAKAYVFLLLVLIHVCVCGSFGMLNRI